MGRLKKGQSAWEGFNDLTAQQKALVRNAMDLAASEPGRLRREKLRVREAVTDALLSGVSPGIMAAVLDLTPARIHQMRTEVLRIREQQTS